jgi:hypothetical protein
VGAHYSLWTSVLLDASSALLHIFWVHFVHGTSTRAGAQGTSTHFSCAGYFPFLPQGFSETRCGTLLRSNQVTIEHR